MKNVSYKNEKYKKISCFCSIQGYKGCSLLFYSAYSNSSLSLIHGSYDYSYVYLSWPHLCVFSHFPHDLSVDTVVFFSFCFALPSLPSIYILKIISNKIFYYFIKCLLSYARLVKFLLCVLSHNSNEILDTNLHYPHNNNCMGRDTLQHYHCVTVAETMQQAIMIYKVKFIFVKLLITAHFFVMQNL